MKLYYVPRTRSSRPRWMLEELGVPYELVRLDPTRGETRTDEHTSRHPLQHVPVLETRDGSIFESAAIVLHLADLHPEQKLLGGPGTHARALAYQWLFFAMTELEPPCIEFLTLKRARQHEAPEGLAVKEKFSLAIRPLERRFSSSDFLIGDQFSAGDVVVGSVLAWANSLKLIEDAPHVSAYLEHIKARPAFQKAYGD
jgi:glutathione S-transferase